MRVSGIQGRVWVTLGKIQEQARAHPEVTMDLTSTNNTVYEMFVWFLRK